MAWSLRRLRFLFERSFSESSDVLLRHLRGRPECRDLFEELARDARTSRDGGGGERSAA